MPAMSVDLHQKPHYSSRASPAYLANVLNCTAVVSAVEIKESSLRMEEFLNLGRPQRGRRTKRYPACLWTSQRLNTWLLLGWHSKSLTSHVAWNCNISNFYNRTMVDFASFGVPSFPSWFWLWTRQNPCLRNPVEAFDPSPPGRVRPTWSQLSELHPETPEKIWETTIADVFKMHHFRDSELQNGLQRSHLHKKHLGIVMYIDLIAWLRVILSLSCTSSSSN